MKKFKIFCGVFVAISLMGLFCGAAGGTEWGTGGAGALSFFTLFAAGVISFLVAYVENLK